MSYFYNINSIPVILNKFKVNNIVISGDLENNLTNIVLKYAENDNISIRFIDLDKFRGGLFLDEFKKLHDYDAIFINDDPNWYTLFNELNLIKNNNEFFPLVFICHDVYPNKKRDAYINPNVIPEEFRIDYSQDFKLGEISLNDGLYHALNENTPKNGVSTAIEDFLSENSSIKLMDFCLDNGTKILYLDDEFTKPILKILADNLTDYLSNENIEDIIDQNNFLSGYVSNLDDVQYQKSNNKDSLNKIKIQNYEINYKNSQITALESKLDLKDTQIKNFEIKLYNAQIDSNKNNEKINNLSDEVNSLRGVVSQRDESISDLSDEVNSLRGVVSQRDGNISDLNNQIISLKTNNLEKNRIVGEIKNKLNRANNQISSLNEDLSLNEEIYNNGLFEFKNQINGFKMELNSLKETLGLVRENEIELSNQIIDGNQKISNKDVEISYLKNGAFLRMFLSPLVYFILIFKSGSKNILTNIKLYRKLKNSEYFDVGYYLNEYSDMSTNKWCKYFSPELHYVCVGLEEGRRCRKFCVNKSTEDLLNEIMNDNQEG